MKELLSAQQKWAQREKASASPERMSLADFKKLQNPADKVSELSSEIGSSATIAQNVKLDNIQKHQDDQLKKLNKTVEQGLINKGAEGVNSNIIKLFKEVKKQTESIRQLSHSESKDITDKAMGRTVYKTISDRARNKVESLKDFFTARGFLDKSGLVKRGTGGILDTALARREERQEYVKARLDTKDPTVNLYGRKGAAKIFGEQFDKQQVVQREMVKNEAKIKKLQDLGFTEKQIQRSDAFKQRGVLATNLASIDTRVRPENFKPKFGGIVDPSTQLVPSRKINQDLTGDNTSEEAANEQQRRFEEQTDILKQIEENTASLREESQKPKKVEGDNNGFLNGVLGGLTSTLMSGLTSAFKVLLNPRNILKFLGKVALPAMIIGSVVNGIIDGFKEFGESGDIGKALIAGFGGILEFISFGLFDKKTIENIVDAVSGFYSEYIEKPIAEFVDSISGVFKNISDFFTTAIDSFTGMIKNIGIPEVKFNIPVINKEVSIGPFYPFAEEGQKSSVTAETPPTAAKPTSANAIYEQSANNAQAAAAPVIQSSPVVVSAPTTNVNNNQTSIMRIPSKNNDPTLKDYYRSRYA